MRAFAWFVAGFVAAGLIAAALAFPAYELTQSFANWAFHRVASRIAMLVLIGILIGLCRHLNLKTKRDFGYGLPWRRFLRVSLLWGVIGMMSAAAGALFLLATQLRVGAAEFTPSALNVARIFLVGLGSGIAVALLEETVFRGLMHTEIGRASCRERV